jgi:leucyl/phenylalanyl-tRNA--protein transferase
VAVFLLSRALAFPPPEGASPEGVVAIGGDFRPERLLLGYQQGIFPWPTEGFPLMWFCPDPRFVLVPEEALVSRSLRRRIRRGEYEIRADTAFCEVIEACADSPRPGQDGTWITDALIEGYAALHERGFAHSVEAYLDGALVGGLYGVAIGGVFFGESMFARAPDASKVAFVTLLGNLVARGFALVDCQVFTEHLARFGATEWPREDFLAALREAVVAPGWEGRWSLSLSPREALASLDRAARGPGEEDEGGP